MDEIISEERFAGLALLSTTEQGSAEGTEAGAERTERSSIAGAEPTRFSQCLLCVLCISFDVPYPYASVFKSSFTI